MVGASPLYALQHDTDRDLEGIAVVARGLARVWQEIFCHLTCSPDSSTFVNVTAMTLDRADRDVIGQVSVFIDQSWADGFYNSCSEVTFSQSNAPAMLFVGGGAEDAAEFLTWLGQEQYLGSPFQIDFPNPETSEQWTPWAGTLRKCYEEGVESRCTCVDCSQVCPPLPEEYQDPEACYVGVIRCLPFTLLMVFTGAFLIIVLTLLYLRKNKQDGYIAVSESGVINEEPKIQKDWVVYAWLKRYRHRVRLTHARGRWRGA